MVSEPQHDTQIAEVVQREVDFWARQGCRNEVYQGKGILHIAVSGNALQNKYTK